MKTTYTPAPIDTSSILLPQGYLPLREIIAKHIHDTWSEERIREGWIYGPYRDDALRTHPCLVPYEELSESEKEFDRIAAEQTLKIITKLGFEITKK